MTIQNDNPKYKLSAVVLVYNGGEYLRPCLQSLADQTLEGLEVILINDVSTDDSLSVCKEFERDYENFRIIDKQVNEGLATNANIGIENARGEYMIFVDNDDIIPPYAYETLYNNAKETDADICVGKPNYLKGYQTEMSSLEINVYDKRRVISDINEFPYIFHDAFYWNKIIRRSLLVENNIKMPTGMIYADRHFSHKAYTCAKKICIIPEVVYLWRIRGDSLSNKKRETSNYINRIDSYELNLDYFTNSYSEYFKILMLRVIKPISGILNSKTFEKTFFERSYKILKNEEKKLDNIYDNDLTNIENIYIYLILNKKFEDVKKLVELDLVNEREIINENNKSYWNLPFFRNEECEIPDELFEIKRIENQFVRIGKVNINNESIIFDEIEIPKYFSIEKGEIVFIGRSSQDESFEENSIYYDMIPVENEENRNLFKASIPNEDLKTFEVYDIHLKTQYKDKPYDKIRLQKSVLENYTNENNELNLYFTPKENMSITSAQLDGKFEIKMEKDRLKILTDGNDIRKELKIYLKKESANEKFQLALNENKTAYELEWKFFLDKKSNYSIHLTVFNEQGKRKKNIKLDEKYLRAFKETSFKNNEGINLKLYKKGKNIYLKS